MRKTLATTAPDFHCHSTLSTGDGMGSPKAVVARAKELGWSAVCLTEHGHMCSAPALYKEARAARIKPIIGCELYVVPDEVLGIHDKEFRHKTTRHLTVLALSREGYQNLLAWTSFSMLRENFYGSPRISLDAMADVAPWPLHHNIVLSGCLGSALCQSLLHSNGNAENVGLAYLESMRELFPNFYVEIQNHRREKLYGKGFEAYDRMVDTQLKVNDWLVPLARKLSIPIVITGDSHFQKPEQRKTHMAMMAAKGWRSKQIEAHHGDASSAQISGFAKDYVYFASYMSPIEPLAEAMGLEDAIENIKSIVDECDIRLEPLDSFSYSLPWAGYQDPVEEIRARCKARLKRLKAIHGAELVTARFERELEVMADFADYLMLTADILVDARNQGILTWTRGSAANSVVCYCLSIHDLDPFYFKLIFERFMNPSRKKLPDIDIDIQSSRRDDFLRLVKERMEKFEGPDNVLSICTYSTLANRAAFRLAAEAVGMSKERANDMADLLPKMIDSGFVGDENDVYSAVKEEFPELAEVAATAFDQVKGISQHACAYVLGTKDRPLKEWIPSMLIASSGTQVTQYNMASIEDFGFVKGDYLKLDSLDIIANILRMVGRDPFDMYSIPLDDEAAYELLSQGRTEGIHSMQGKTQRRGCMEVQPDTIHDLVAIQALYRPSGTRSGYDKMFVKRRRGEEEYELSDLEEEVLGDTHGLPLYQEQVMELGSRMGATDEENQQLLAAIKMAKGVGVGAKEEMDKLEPIYMGYATKILEEETARDLWRKIETSQGYGFNRGHASSYAGLAYIMAYLRAHYPREHFAALLDAYPNNGRYIGAAYGEGYSFQPPDVNESGSGFSRGSGDSTIRVGLSRIKGLGPGAVGEILRKQPFSSMDDLRERCSTTSVKSPQIEALRSVGAFSQFGVRSDDDDFVQYKHLGFCLRSPRVFKRIRPKLPSRNGTWKFLGLTDTSQPTEGKQFCAKLFWIPPIEKQTDLIKLVASPWAQVKSHLLQAVDINGIPFELIAPEKKKAESQILQLLAKFGKGTVICAEGQVSMPFDRGHPSGFKLWSISTNDEGPLIWHCKDERLPEWINGLNQYKRQ